MKKVKLIVSMVLCMFLLVGCGNTLSNKDLRVLKENVTAHSVEIDKYITSREEYKNAVLANLKPLGELPDFVIE